ncbi:unnamed protein product [Amaranthus hypochondriacus]
MDSPYFRSYFQSPSPSPYRRGPAYVRSPYNRTPTEPSRPKKVISIPVHSIDSEMKTYISAVKIQKAFRGFWVKKTVKRILELKRQVDDVEKKLHDRETMVLIKKDGVERLKVNEGIMSLLLKLDSVRGIDGGVRELRKGVIKKAIMLQELIDSLINDENIDDDNGETLGKSGENVDNSAETSGETLEKSEEDADNSLENSDDSSKMQVENSREFSDKTLEKDGVNDELDCVNSMQIESDPSRAESRECVVDETVEQNSELIEASKEEENLGVHENCEAGEENTMNESMDEQWFFIDDHKEKKDEKEKLLEKMAEDNQKLMSMMEDLCKKNSLQTKLIFSLSQRVDQLEKAMNDRLRKKKKSNLPPN